MSPPSTMPGRTDPIAPIVDWNATFPRMAGSQLHLGFFLALLLAVGTWWLLDRTPLGFQIRAVGSNPNASATAGMNTNSIIAWTMIISGGLAGMAGVSETAGLKGYLTLDLSPGFGFTGIAVAMLAQLNPIGVIPAAIFLSAIYVGSDAMSRAVNIPTFIADVLVGVSVLAVLCSVMFSQYRVRWRT